MIVSEVFGPTFQGEGPNAGMRAGFIRLGRCNLDCSWCDTPYTWDWKRYDPAVELSRVDIADVLADIEAMDVPLVVVTGGEPLIQRTEVQIVAAWAVEHDKVIEVETNGTRMPLDEHYRIAYRVSPKLSGSGVDADKRYKPKVLDALAAQDAAFKFVISDVTELDEVQQLVDAHHLRRVWIMPEGTSAEKIAIGLGILAPLVLDRGWNLCGRMHVTLWGDKRGH